MSNQEMEDISTLDARINTNASSNEDRSYENVVNEHTLDGNEKIEEPKVDMVFNSQEDIYRYYTNYARQEGFVVTRRTSKCGDDGRMRYFTLACSRTGRTQCAAKNALKSNLSTKTQCPAKLRSALQPDERFKLTTVVLEHNHALCPGKALFFRRKKRLDQHVKRRFEENDQARCGGYEKAKRLRLGVGDVEAIQKYFIRMQDKNSSFFYMMDLDEECRVRNLFWADAKSRATYEAFGDVVTVDTTYLTNKYNIPFALFVGVNHHGQSVLLGCGLLSNEDMETFVWLFESWLACMFGCPPKAIITDQCKAIQGAIEMVFPDARHRWCLGHIMRKIPNKLRGYYQYEAIKKTLQTVVYDSFTRGEFEQGWRRMIDEYGLHDNEWLGELYDERCRWVPIYVKNTFWAGMSTKQHGDNMHAFFDGCVNSKTTLKQFFEQYDNILRSKVEKETQADYHSVNSMSECVTDYDIEKQFQGAYTNTKFKEFQEELKGKIYCYPSIIKEEGSIYTYEVAQDVKIGDGRKDVVFSVYFNEVECEVKCMCHLFEFSGILCRHSLSVLTQRKVKEVPTQYILSRWKKDLRRNYTFVKDSYGDLGAKSYAQRYQKMCKDFFEVAVIAAVSEEKCNVVMSIVHGLKDKFLTDESICGSNQSTQVALAASPNCADGDNGLRTQENTFNGKPG
ncbi:hypothetical protein L1049_020565 [Liquidambar formosana]|uniref:Protein FAR1-RELATED SEQUENCE n=1 Tax=Liquidambar formosana TaxID=63359 RepID=A0AAP0SDA7_LIQFO